jgi:hypothetical protein
MSFVGIKRRRILHRFQNYKLTLVTKRLFQDKDFRLYTSLAADILNTAQIGPLRPLIRLVGVFLKGIVSRQFAIFLLVTLES